TEHFCVRGQLNVHLEPEHRIESGKRLVEVHEFGRRVHWTAPPFSSGNRCANDSPAVSSRAFSNAAPTRYNRSSAVVGAMICSPTGIPSSSDSPLGTLIAGIPVRLAGAVNRSARYIAAGWPPDSPNSGAVVGVVGDTSTSACANALSKSRHTRVRTRCAAP